MDDILSPNLIKINANDNIVIVRQKILKNTPYMINNQSFKAKQDIPIGFKIACQNILKGENILKYNVPIGIACCDIELGTLIHTHNIESRYLGAVLNHEQQEQAQKGRS